MATTKRKPVEKLDPLKFFEKPEVIKKRLLRKVAAHLRRDRRRLGPERFKDYCLDFRPPLSKDELQKILSGDINIKLISGDRAYNLFVSFGGYAEDAFKMIRKPNEVERQLWEKEMVPVRAINDARGGPKMNVEGHIFRRAIHAFARS